MATKKAKPTLAMKRGAALEKDRLQYSAKRESIIKAAGPVLQRQGLSGTTIGAIAKEAGVDRATIYYYFPDKQSIFREAIHGGLQDMVNGLEEVAKSGDAPDERLRTSMRAVMRAYEKHYPQLYIFFQDGARGEIIDNELNAELVESGRRYEDLLEQTVRDGIADGVLATSLPPKVFAKLVVGMLNWTSHWFVPGGPLTADDIADGMADTVLSGSLVSPDKGRKK